MTPFHLYTISSSAKQIRQLFILVPQILRLIRLSQDANWVRLGVRNGIGIGKPLQGNVFGYNIMRYKQIFPRVATMAHCVI